MGTVEQDLAEYERRMHKEDLVETARELAVKAETKRLVALPLTAVIAEALALPGLIGVEFSNAVADIAEAIVDARHPDDGFDPDNQPAPRYWEGP